MAQIAVIGMSSFGYYLARTLSEKKSKVLAIDQDEVMIDKVKPCVAKAIIADATDVEVLKKLELASMDAVVISLGSSLDASILVAMHLKELGAKRIVAKANSEDHVRILEHGVVGHIIEGHPHAAPFKFQDIAPLYGFR